MEDHDRRWDDSSSERISAVFPRKDALGKDLRTGPMCVAGRGEKYTEDTNK